MFNVTKLEATVALSDLNLSAMSYLLHYALPWEVQELEQGWI